MARLDAVLLDAGPVVSVAFGVRAGTTDVDKKQATLRSLQDGRDCRAPAALQGCSDRTLRTAYQQPESQRTNTHGRRLLPMALQLATAATPALLSRCVGEGAHPFEGIRNARFRFRVWNSWVIGRGALPPLPGGWAAPCKHPPRRLSGHSAPPTKTRPGTTFGFRIRIFVCCPSC